jgi:hypothetical protein
MSAAKAEVAETASAATTDKTTFFIDPALFHSTGIAAGTFATSLGGTDAQGTERQQDASGIKIHWEIKWDKQKR